MNYEEKYKHALDLAKQVYDATISEQQKENISIIFPELAESEDEKIRKTLIEYFSIGANNNEITCNIEDKKILSWLEKQGQKPAEKAETKFHIGDWVIWDNKVICYIDNIYQGKESLMYTITDTNNMIRSYSVKGFDNNARHWTIQDAKDGDVLARNNDILSICIFSHFDGINNKFSSFVCYCGLEGESINGYHDDSKNYVPATKEQRDTLFAKMREAGYTFDFEKKELKKIGQKPAEWSEEDEMVLNTTIAFLDEFKTKGYENAMMCIDWLKFFKQRIGG